MALLRHALSITSFAAAVALVAPPVATRAQAARPRTWRPNVTRPALTAADLRAAYAAPRGPSSATGMTVASVQFSGWRRSDLATFAAASGVAMPDIVERRVGKVDPRLPDGEDGDVEVALDHEALLAAAPGATHLIFFGSNDDAGTLKVYDAVAVAAERGEFDVLSISWGQCELQLSAAVLSAVNRSLRRIVAAGRTVFAASGDEGGTDCTEPKLRSRITVDFPASSPYVVAVGGTSLTARPDGSWDEVGWNEPTPAGAASSGGGFSRVFARPDWQPPATADDPPGPKMRMVPDIAALADSRSGFAMFAASQGGWVPAGGTSLATPLAAGHFTSVLAAAGKTNGLRRPLQQLLYGNPQLLRDVVSGANGVYAAAAGYDHVSGLGAPLWQQLLPVIATGPIVSAPSSTRARTIPVRFTLPAGAAFVRYRICESNDDARCDSPDLQLTPDAAPYLLRISPGPSRRLRVIVVGFDAAGLSHPGSAYVLYDVTAPVATAAARITSESSATARFSWGAVDPGPGVGVESYDVRVSKAGTPGAVHVSSGPATSWLGAVSRGSTYTVAVRATDRLGNVSVASSATLVVPLDDSDFLRSGAWRVTAHPAAYGGSVSTAAGPASATVAVRGRSADLLFSSGPTAGLVDVFVDGVRAARVDTYSATPQNRRSVRVAGWNGPAPRVITVRALGTHSAQSTGAAVTIDGLQVNWT